MSLPPLLKGTYISIAVEDPDAPGEFIGLCGVTTETLTEAVQTSDNYVRDCQDPEYIPVRELDITGRSWEISGQAYYNRQQAALLRRLIGKIVNYRFFIKEPAADAIDSGYYQGGGAITNRTIQGGDTGKATGNITIASDGEWLWTDTTASVPTLQSLVLGDLTAVANENWASPITHRAYGSTISATASDGTPLTVNDDTVTAEFTTTGSKTITLIETLAGATGSPKTTTQTVVVS